MAEAVAVQKQATPVEAQAHGESNLPLWRWVPVLAPGLFLYFAPLPAFSSSQRHLLAIFVSTILGMVIRPIAMGVSAFVGMTLLIVTHTLSPVKALSGFSNLTVWLVFTAFLFARAVTVTRLGSRVAYLFIRRFGSSALALGYSITASDLVLAPFVPSDTARGGGIIYPIARSVSHAFNSDPGPTSRKIGSFIMLVGFHSTYTASAIFLTGMAANPLIADFARKIANVDLTWGRWLLGSCVPGLVTLVLVPFLIYRLCPPEVRDTEPARALARQELKNLGPVARKEVILILVMFLVMLGWITSPWHKIPNAVVAMAGVSAILLLGVINWEDLLAEKRAWDAIIWFAPVLMMADALQEAGVINILSGAIFHHMHGWSWPVSMVVLAVLYLYLHYGFASMTAHITALFPGFLAASLAAGVPPLLAVLPLAYFSNLNAGMTHYGTGSAPVYFGDGYVTQGTWWRIGFLISAMNVCIWLVIGVAWWKLLGWW
ncbi:MAG: DASS family sodium-coupled anion symporter [Terriglobales bacterium]